MGDYNSSFENIYNGGMSSMDPEGGNFVGYRMNAGTIGSPTSVQTANQLKEVMTRLREGVKNVELQPLAEGVFDQIPKQHFEEMRQLMKISGVKASVHAPIVDPAGFGQEGYAGEAAREDAERRLNAVIEKSHLLDPTGNIPIVIHSSGATPGDVYVPGEGEDRFHTRRKAYINQETDKFRVIEEEETYDINRPEDFSKGGTVKKIDAEGEKDLNEREWSNQVHQLNYYHHDTERAKYEFESSGYSDLLRNGGPEEEVKIAQGKLGRMNNSLQNTGLMMKDLFNTAYKYGDDSEKEKLKSLAEKWKKEKEEFERNNPSKVDQFMRAADLVEKQIQELAVISPPKVYKPVNDFAMEKAAETFGNVAWNAYNKVAKGDIDSTPMMAIENMYQGMAFSKADDMKKLVAKSREQFVENAVKKGMDKDSAEKKAEKILGVTWDVGHLNMMKKAGFEDKDVVSETEKIAPLVKHVHLTDNFGFSDSHLAPGMGNVPMKEILKKLEEKGKVGEMRKIIEAGGFVQHFQKSPHPWTMSAFGSPIYGMKQGGYWNQTMEMSPGGGYFGGYGTTLPEKHFQTYGAGFSGLPQELGGQIGTAQSRFTGTPNA